MATENSTAGAGPLLGGTAGRRFASLNVPDGDAGRIGLRGTLASFAAPGLDIDAKFKGPIARQTAISVEGADGHQWEVWGDDPFGMYASRLRTSAERERWVDRRNAIRVSSFFSVDRAHACAVLAAHSIPWR